MTRLTPHDWQERDIVELLFNDCTGIAAIETGGGKSLLAVEAALRSGLHEVGAVLVIAPKSTFKKTWVKTFVNQGGPVPRQIDSTKAGKIADADLRANRPGVYLLNHELFTRREWDGVKPELCILDEAHKISNRDSKGNAKLRKFKAKRRLAMSATPYRNNFENMWGLLRWVYSDRDDKHDIADISFWRWASEYCIVEQDFFAGKVVRGEKFPGRIASLIPCYIYHAKRKNCCEFHPEGFLATMEPEPVVRTVELTPKMRKAYAQLERDYVAWLGENPLVVELPIVMRTRLRQMALGELEIIPGVDGEPKVTYPVDGDSPKYNDLLDILDNEVPDEQVLVVTHSREFAIVCAQKLRRDGYTVAEWNGSILQKERDLQGELFESGEARIMLATIASLGTGTDFLQRVTSTIIWLSRTDDPTENQQTEGRLDRMGGIGRVTSIEIQAEGTHDAGIMGKDLAHALALNATLSPKKP